MGQTDKAIRRLVDLSQAGLVSSLLSPAEVRVLGTEPSELQVVERVTDKVVRACVDGVETIIDVEFQATHDERFPGRLLAYHALLRQHHYPLPVRSIAVYLMHEPPTNGVPRRISPSRSDPQLAFTYDLFCAWEQPISLNQVRANPHLGPLASLTPAVGAADLVNLQRIIENARQPRVVRGELLALTYILASRRFDKALLESMLRSNIMLEDSPGYQELIARGEARGKEIGTVTTLRRKVLRLVQHRLGEVPNPLAQQLKTLGAQQLDALFDSVLEAQDAAAIEAIFATIHRDA